MRVGNRWWYARRVVNGRRALLKLGIEIRGTRPATLRAVGDAEFEASRAEAQAAYARRVAELDEHPSAEWYLRMAELLSQKETKVADLPLAELLKAWIEAPHARRRSARYVERAGATVREFVRILARHPRPPTHVGAITTDHAEHWAKAVANVAPGTFNSKLILLRSVLWAVRRRTGITSNPLGVIPTVEHEAMHRVPMSPEEVRKLVACADPVLRGPVVTAACTAMRLGDCCRLTWGSVDLAGGWIRATSHKTGEPIEMPILPMLRRELAAAAGDTKPKPDARVWLNAWMMYEGNRAGLSYRMRKAFAAAGIERMADRTGPAVKKRASVRDFHALRTTWITTAIENGLPMDLVRKVTGHRTVDVVLRHYVHPGRVALGKGVRKALGKLGA